MWATRTYTAKTCNDLNKKYRRTPQYDLMCNISQDWIFKNTIKEYYLYLSELNCIESGVKHKDTKEIFTLDFLYLLI